MEVILNQIDEVGETLNFCRCDISDEILEEIGDKVMCKEGLRKLWLGSNHISDISTLFEGLRHNTSLKLLHLSGNDISDLSPLTEGLRYNTSLEILYLRWVSLIKTLR